MRLHSAHLERSPQRGLLPYFLSSRLFLSSEGDKGGKGKGLDGKKGRKEVSVIYSINIEYFSSSYFHLTSVSSHCLSNTVPTCVRYQLAYHLGYTLALGYPLGCKGYGRGRGIPRVLPGSVFSKYVWEQPQNETVFLSGVAVAPRCPSGRPSAGWPDAPRTHAARPLGQRPRPLARPVCKSGASKW